MKNKRGMTVVELITSFALVISIATLLLGIIINLRDIYESSGIKTQLLNKQAQISQAINSKLLEQEIETVTNCGTGCLNFKYTDGTSDLLMLDNVNKTISFGSYKTQILNDSYFKNPTAEIVRANTFEYDSNDAILKIDIPIYNDYLEEQNFGINIIYPFNTSTTDIASISFDVGSHAYNTNGLLIHYSGKVAPSNNTWYDLSGNGNDGTLSGFDATGGWNTNYIRFDGTDDYINVPLDDINKSSAGTIIIVYEMNGWGNSYSTIFARGNGGSWANNHIQISRASTSTTSLNFNIANNSTSTSGSPTMNVGLNNIYAIAMTWDGTSIKNYLNGNLNATTSSTLLPASDSTMAYIGRGLDGGTSRMFNGKIYSFRIYDRALTANEINAEYQTDLSYLFDYEYDTNGLILHYSGTSQPVNGVWADLSGNGNDGTLYGFDSTTGWSVDHIRFDGVNDYVISKNNLGISGDASLTMCTVASWQGSSWSTDWPSYMGTVTNGTGTNISIPMNSGRPAMDFWNYRYLSNTALSVGQIYHICVTKAPGPISTTSAIYVNGVAYAGTGNSTASPNIVDSKALVGKLDDTRWANANIYNAMFYNRTLTQAEIQELYQIDKKRFNF